MSNRALIDRLQLPNNLHYRHADRRNPCGAQGRLMRLSKIRLTGFKSFVDPTTVYLSSNLTGVVGPNGCGKSNVIEPLRSVMGELSARHLRADSLADVIFNGSSSRKPVGTASVELAFDNSDGKIGGAYASYAEISLKRLLAPA